VGRPVEAAAASAAEEPSTPTMISLATAADLALPALQVAPRLLGGVISSGEVSIMITEVEAYEGTDDPASHAWRGPTPRTTIMFGPPGHVYVYLSHGLHHAMNLVCGPDGVASAVLLRGGTVVAGVDRARQRRPGVADDRLARGPGNLTRALGVDLRHNGLAVDLAPGGAAEDVPMARGPRVGVSRAAERPWRFWWRGAASVSPYRRSPRAPREGEPPRKVLLDD